MGGGLGDVEVDEDGVGGGGGIMLNEEYDHGVVDDAFYGYAEEEEEQDIYLS